MADIAGMKTYAPSAKRITMPKLKKAKALPTMPLAAKPMNMVGGAAMAQTMKRLKAKARTVAHGS